MQPLQICTTNSSHLFRASERSHVPRRPHQILQLCVYCLVSFSTVWIQCLCIQQIKAYVLSVRVPMKTGSYVAVDLTLKRYFPWGQHSCYQINCPEKKYSKSLVWPLSRAPSKAALITFYRGCNHHKVLDEEENCNYFLSFEQDRCQLIEEFVKLKYISYKPLLYQATIATMPKRTIHYQGSP